MSAARQCRVCRADLAGRRRDAKFCGDRCRQANQRGKGTAFRPVRVSFEVTASDRDRMLDEGILPEWDESDREAIRRAFRSMVESFRDSHDP
jgi:hypothetical protein